MPRPVPHTEGSRETRPILGEVHILVYGLERGKTEIQVRFPDDALGSSAEATRRREEFSTVVRSELAELLPRMVGGQP